ncbi:MAG TPA: class I SAM-dependent methyltransferase [Casimicrobiaceae bacterium]|nr:class I SAM-dependent methyltransferase [Casimicrobiaceae bacterium]
MATFENPQETWNQRYASADYLFGESPNEFVRATTGYLVEGQSVLCVADGEGRNSVWLAERGLQVTAFDFAQNAVDKARRLAQRRNVSVDFHVADIETWRFESARYDAVVAIFIQFLGPKARDDVFKRMQSSVKPGGLFLLEGYRPEQLQYRTGGPGAIENLYTREWVEHAFADWQILSLRAYDAVLSEGTRHSGMSALIDVVARKR